MQEVFEEAEALSVTAPPQDLVSKGHALMAPVALGLRVRSSASPSASSSSDTDREQRIEVERTLPAGSPVRDTQVSASCGSTRPEPGSEVAVAPIKCANLLK